MIHSWKLWCRTVSRGSNYVGRAGNWNRGGCTFGSMGFDAQHETALPHAQPVLHGQKQASKYHPSIHYSIIIMRAAGWLRTGVDSRCVCIPHTATKVGQRKQKRQTPIKNRTEQILGITHLQSRANRSKKGASSRFAFSIKATYLGYTRSDHQSSRYFSPQSASRPNTHQSFHSDSFRSSVMIITHNLSINHRLTLPSRDLDSELRFLPQRMHLGIAMPINLLIQQFQIVGKEQLGQDGAEFQPAQTTSHQTWTQPMVSASSIMRTLKPRE